MNNDKKLPGDYPQPPPPTFAQWLSGMAAVGVPIHLLPAEQQQQQQRSAVKQELKEEVKEEVKQEMKEEVKAEVKEEEGSSHVKQEDGASGLKQEDESKDTPPAKPEPRVKKEPE